MNRRKFLSYVGCSCGGLLLNSCSTAPITDRKQLKLIPEAKLNAQAAQIFEKVKEKEKLSKDTKTLDLIKEIGKTAFGFDAFVMENFSIIFLGVAIVVILIVEPHGLARLWQITKQKLRLWPFPY